MVKYPIIIALLLLLPFSSASLLDGLSHRYNLDESSGNLNDNIANFDLVNTYGTPIYSQSGVNGYSISAESTTHFAAGINFNPNTSGTYCAWLYPDELGNSKFFTGSNLGGYNLGDWYLGMHLDKPFFMLSDLSTENVIYGDNAMVVGQWWLVCAEWSDITGMKLWVNGTVQSTTNPGITLKPKNNTALNLFSDDGIDGAWLGKIDEVYIWNRSLSSAEHLQLFNYFDSDIINYTTNLVNNSVYFKKNIVAQINITTINLTLWNVSIDSTNLDGDLAPTYDHYIYNLSYSSVNLAPGSHTINVHAVSAYGEKIESYPFYVTDGNVNYTNGTNEGDSSNILYLTINLTGTGLGIGTTNATLNYNNTAYSVSKSNDANYIYFSAITTTPQLNEAQSDINFTWNISLPGETYLWNLSQIVKKGNINNCSNTSYAMALNISSIDEDTLLGVPTFSWRSTFQVYTNNSNSYTNYTFSLNGNSSYGICIFPNTTNYRVNAIMEYGDGNYSARKYYLRNYILTNTTQYIYLYNINDTISSDVIITVIDKKDGSRVPDAYVKILRYYVGENVYRTVEIEKTDQYGQTVAKMIQADIFYKFMIENEAGVTLLNSDVTKITSSSIIVPINTATNVLGDYYASLDLPYDLSCTVATRTCRFTWNNPKNTAITGRLTIYQSTGITKLKIYEEEATSVAASIIYTFANVTNHQYYVEAALIQ